MTPALTMRSIHGPIGPRSFEILRVRAMARVLPSPVTADKRLVIQDRMQARRC
jgi:hypothetical protein